MNKRPKVVYWNNMPAPYMVDRFNALANNNRIDLEVWFNERNVPGRSWDIDESTWSFRYHYVPVSTLFGRRWHNILPLIFRCRANILVSLYHEPAFVLGWFIARLRGIKTAFRVLATSDFWANRHWAKDLTKKYLFSRVDAIETPGEDGKRFAIKYGARQERIFLATHTVDVDRMVRAIEGREEEARRLRDELGLVGTVYLYVGRLLAAKGIHDLLEAFRSVQEATHEAVSLLLIGDGPDEKALRDYVESNHLMHVVFGGYKQKNEIPMYFALADVFVFPTLGDAYGLVVDEAMTCSLPIISTDQAGEIKARVRNGENGFIVEAKSSEALAGAMLKLADDEKLRREMGTISRQIVSGHTPEQWASEFEEMILSLLENDKSMAG